MPQRRKTPSEIDVLRARFKTALAEAGLSMTAWAAKNEWSTAHVILTLAGKRESDRVLDAVRAFTNEQENRIRERLSMQPSAA